MITLGGVATKIHLATDSIDLRRGISGLYTLAEQQFKAEPQFGNLWCQGTADNAKLGIVGLVPSKR